MMIKKFKDVCNVDIYCNHFQFILVHEQLDIKEYIKTDFDLEICKLICFFKERQNIRNDEIESQFDIHFKIPCIDVLYQLIHKKTNLCKINNLNEKRLLKYYEKGFKIMNPFNFQSFSTQQYFQNIEKNEFLKQVDGENIDFDKFHTFAEKNGYKNLKSKYINNNFLMTTYLFLPKIKKVHQPKFITFQIKKNLIIGDQTQKMVRNNMALYCLMRQNKERILLENDIKNSKILITDTHITCCLECLYENMENFYPECIHCLLHTHHIHLLLDIRAHVILTSFGFY